MKQLLIIITSLPTINIITTKPENLMQENDRYYGKIMQLLISNKSE